MGIGSEFGSARVEYNPQWTARTAGPATRGQRVMVLATSRHRGIGVSGYRGFGVSGYRNIGLAGYRVIGDGKAGGVGRAGRAERAGRLVGHAEPCQADWRSGGRGVSIGKDDGVAMVISLFHPGRVRGLGHGISMDAGHRR